MVISKIPLFWLVLPRSFRQLDFRKKVLTKIREEIRQAGCQRALAWKLEKDGSEIAVFGISRFYLYAKSKKESKLSAASARIWTGATPQPLPNALVWGCKRCSLLRKKFESLATGDSKNN